MIKSSHHVFSNGAKHSLYSVSRMFAEILATEAIYELICFMTNTYILQ